MSAVPIVDQNSVTNREEAPSFTPSDEEKQHPDSKHADDHLYKSGGFSVASTNSSLSKFYVPPSTYESAHRFDPNATWTPEEETKLRRSLDWRVALFVCVCFAALQLDRGNISNALSDNMLNDLKMTTNEYNTGQTIFYLFFLAAELPSQLVSKKVGVDRWVPFQMVAWSIVAISQAGIKGKSGFYVTRALLGLLEGGFIADMILYLSYFYTAAELTIRLSFFWVSLTTTTIIGSLLAAGILQLRGVHGLPGWKYLFLIEGVITLAVGVFAFFYLPPSPTQTRTALRPNGWFTEREEVIIVNKVLRDDPSKASMHNRQALTFKDLGQSLADYDLWPLYLLGLTTFMATGTVNAYFTLTLKSLGFSTLDTNLLSIPSAVLFIILNVSLAYTSKKLKERTLVASIGSWWQLIFFIVIVTLPDSTGKWVKYAVLSLLLAYPYAHPILVSMNSMNAGSVRTRTVASSVYNMFVQASSLVSSNIYRSNDAPYYHKGNKVLIAIVCVNLILFHLTKVFYIWKNNRRDKVWDAWSDEEKAHYLQTTNDKGNKRLDFRFLH